MTIASRARWAEQHYPDPNAFGSGGQALVYSVVLRPGDPLGDHDNVFTTFTALYAMASTVPGGVRVSVDDSLAPTHITAGVYNLDGWVIVNGEGEATLLIDDGASATWNNLWLDGLIVQGNNTAPFFHPTSGQANLYISDGATVQSLAAGPFIQADGTSFVFVTSAQADNIGDGAHVTFTSTGAGALELFMSGGSLAPGSITGSGSSLNWESSTSVPDLTTLTGVSLFYESGPQQASNGGVANVPAATINIVSAPIGIARRKSGFVHLDCVFCVQASDVAATLTGQFTRDGAPIGQTFPITGSAGPSVQIAGNYIDQLPDNALHTYNFQAAATLGTVASIAGQGQLRIVEY
jgi:hypothetical protein